jgi:multiple sugar transport system substrate-binding protein/putative aldouronate transport system substrate-binding protein
MIMYVKSTATAYYGFDEFEMGLYDFDTGDFYPTLLPGGPYLEMLEFYNGLHRRGLLDPDSSSQNWDPMIAKVQNGGTLFSIFNFSGSENYNSDRHIDENKIMLPVAPENARQFVAGLNVYGGSRVWTIGAKSQYPELVMEIINWLCTPEGRLTVDYGPRGLTWDYDEEGNTYFTELGKRTDADRNTELEAPYSGQFGDGSFQVNNTTWINMSANPESNGDLYNKKFWKRNPPEARNDYERDWREKTGAISAFDYLYSRPKLVGVGTTFSSLARSVEVENAWQQVIYAIKNGSWNAIFANTALEFEDAVAEMIDEAHAKGYDVCVEFSISEAERLTELVRQVRASED